MYEARQNKEKVSRRIDGRFKNNSNHALKEDMLQLIRKEDENKNKEQDLQDFVYKLDKNGKINFYCGLKSINKEDMKLKIYDKYYILSKDDFNKLNKEIKGNKINKRIDKYLRFITDGIENKDYWITWPTYATGDMTSLSVFLINSKNGVVIYKENGYGGDVDNAMNAWSSFLGGDLIDKEYIVTDKGLQGFRSDSTESKRKIGFTEGTNYITKNWNSDIRGKVRKAWGVTDTYDKEIKNWLSDNNITADKYEEKDVIILWIRKSGENGGAHYENDTSFKLLRSYIEKNSQKIFYLAGDDKLDAKGNSKAEALVRDNVVNLTQIWKRKDIYLWKGDSRTGQFNIYDFLKRQSKSLLHIGAMSGNLEAMALLGHKTNFQTIDDRTENPSLERMLKYDISDQEREDEIDKIGYNFSPIDRYEKSAAEYYMKLRYHTKLIDESLSKQFGSDYLDNKIEKYVQAIESMYDGLDKGTYSELKDKYKDSLLSNLFILVAKRIKKKKIINPRP